MHLKTAEVKQILDCTYKMSNWTRKEYSETDSLCMRFATKYATITREPDRRDYLYSICEYLSQGINYHSGKYSLRGSGKKYEFPFNEIAMEYSNKFIDHYSAGPYFDSGMLAQILSNKANFYVQTESYFDAYNTHLLALETARKFNKQHLSRKYAQLARFFEYFDRPEMTLVYCDSASNALSKLPTVSARPAALEAFIIRIRQIANFSLYLKTSDESFADKIQKLHNDSKSIMPRKDRYLAGSYILLSGIAYHHNQYNESLAYVDSASVVYPRYQLLDLWEMAMVYKALSLRKLGRFPESDQTLAKLDLADIKRPIIEQVLMQLYQEELDSDNLKKALRYRDRLSSFREKRYKIDVEGKAIEMEHLFKVRQREREISQLTALQNRNKMILVFAMIVVALVIIILVSRYRRSVFKTQSLVKQLETETQLQVMHLEVARLEERKILGQDLHNGFASSLAAVRQQLELTMMDSEDITVRDKLTYIHNQIDDLYERSRSTSHEWYHGFNEQLQQSFALQIKILADSALPDSHYKKTITVENDEISGISLAMRINLLGIIQELLTNIVKHAKARSIHILIFQDSDFLILNVKDDGVGFDVEKVKSIKKGIGLQSLRESVLKMQGNFKIASDSTGTEVIMTIPLGMAL
ncbi:sensor histidine kinase [Dyadobacter sp. CY312]|uniref:sensor histidine kinase n=1 Tax=Dyadobacter sp. CY312 TaxID=2907303 RepID=UPI001F1D606B|nr:ATP-binding protein [Dyadobacter sp. CY312]MCE7044424.1 ATP-binding protein [Dyadobacter sp. CY312]